MPYALNLGQAAAPGAPPSLLNMALLFLPVLAIWWVLIIRPQQKQESARRAMLKALVVGQKVVTSGGIHGVIAQLGEDTLKLKVADNVRIEVSRSAITGLQPDDGGAAKP